MARKMRKFSEGGAQGKYDRRMADIEKDRKIALAKGKNADVVEAKAAQRKADAEDDRAKRTGADRTATRAAERLAESNLTKTRKYGAPQSVTAAEPAKTTASAATAETAKAKPKTFGEAFKDARSRLGAGKTFTFNGKSFTTNIAGEGRKAAPTAGKPVADKPKPTAASGSSTRAQLETGRAAFRRQTAAKEAELRREANRAAMRRDTAGKAQLVGPADGQEARIRAAQKVTSTVKPVDDKAAKLSRLKVAAEAPGATQFAKDRYKYAASSGMYAKGGKIMKKMAKGGSTPPQPTAAERKADAKFRESLKKIKVTPAQGKVLESANRSEGRGYATGGVTKEMPSSKAMGSMNMAKGGKAKAKPAAKGKAKGNPFAATKFGAAMMKKGADAKGRAMPKFAKGGSIDGCAVRGKTKAKRVTMKKGGSC